MPARITVIGKPSCHLCDLAKEVVDRVDADLHVGVEVLSIDDDDALREKYWDQIPEAVRTPLACTLLVLAALLSIVSFRRWIRIEAAMRHTRPLPVPQASILLVLGIAIGAVLLVVAILAGAIS